MKKLLAFTLVLALLLSLSVTAFAAPSPKKKVVISDFTGGSGIGYITSTGSNEGKVTIIKNSDLNDAQKETVNGAIEKVEEEGYVVSDAFMVEAESDGYVIVEAEDGSVIFVVSESGAISQFELEDLEAVGNNRYKVPVSAGVSSVIVAKAK